MRLSIFVTTISFLLSNVGLAGPLSDAAKKGDTAEVERLLSLGAEVNEPDGIATPIHWAAMSGHDDTVRVLLEAGAGLNAPSDMLGSPLHAAARFDRVGAARELIAKGADPDVRDRDGFTPLMRAVIENRVSMVEALISAGADTDIVAFMRNDGDPAYGPTIALHLALRLERTEIVQLLLAAGAGPIPPDVPSGLWSSGEAERGRELVEGRCISCHLVSAEGSGPIGTYRPAPSLVGVMGRKVADTSFEYSDALVAMKGIWTPERLYSFIFRPMLTAPGTKMFWPPELTPEQVADVIAYLGSSTD